MPARINSARIEAMWDKIDVPDIVTARALASLNDLFKLAEPWLTSGSKALFQKVGITREKSMKAVSAGVSIWYNMKVLSIIAR